MPRHNGASAHKSGPRRQAPRKQRGRHEDRHQMTAHARTVGAPSRRTLTPGAIVFAHIPFIEDGGRYKSRPAVVVELRADDTVVVRPVTGSPHPGPAAVPVTEWEAAGLKKPSSVTARTVVLDRRVDVTGLIGQLSAADLAAVAAVPTRVPMTVAAVATAG